MTDEQVRALRRVMNDRQSSDATVSHKPFDLPEGYILVLFADGFQCGIAPNGDVSS